MRGECLGRKSFAEWCQCVPARSLAKGLAGGREIYQSYSHDLDIFQINRSVEEFYSTLLGLCVCGGGGIEYVTAQSEKG